MQPSTLWKSAKVCSKTLTVEGITISSKALNEKASFSILSKPSFKAIFVIKFLEKAHSFIVRRFLGVLMDDKAQLSKADVPINSRLSLKTISSKF